MVMDNYIPAVKNIDPEIAQLIEQESQRQEDTLMMIPSENMASQAVQQAVGSCLGNKYAEGYPGRRYYQGQKYVDQIEIIAQDRAKQAFDTPHANVQPLSGSPANLAVYLGLLEPGDTLMGLDLSHGGHLTHGSKVSASGIFYNSVSYQLGEDGTMDYEAIEAMAKEHQPKIIIAGITAYPLQVDWARFAEIAEQVGAYLMTDIAHLSGLVVAGAYPSPVPHAHIVTTTTHKTLRGPRGAMILVTEKGLAKDENLAKTIDKAVFPRLQGGPHMNTIAGIAIALKEAMTDKFQAYGEQVVANSKQLAATLKERDFDLVAGGSNTHLILVDLQNKNVVGNLAAEALEAANIVLNRNSVPFDPNPPFYPSGIRMGTPGLTSRGMQEEQMTQVGTWIADVIADIADLKQEQGVEFAQVKKKKVRQELITQSEVVTKVKQQVQELCAQFPVPAQY
jgi:glycine hydroxymethyltransferase